MPLPLLTPIIVAAGTTLVGTFFQDRTDRIKNGRLQRQSILDKADKTYEDLSKVLDTLYYTLMDEAVYIALRKARGIEDNEEADNNGWKTYMAAFGSMEK